MKAWGNRLAVVAAILIVASSGRVESQATSPMVRISAAAVAFGPGQSNAAALTELRDWDTRVTDMVRSGELDRTGAEPDALVPGRTHERFVQRHRGVRVFGADVTRQLNGFGQAESVFGTLYPDLSLSATPAIPRERGEALLGAAGGGRVGALRLGGAELLVLPLDDGRVRLTWSARVRSDRDGLVRRIFIDAATGETVFSYDDTQTQSPTAGIGFGVLADKKKVSTDKIDGMFYVIDQLRPGTAFSFFNLPDGASITFDLKGNPFRLDTIGIPTLSDIGVDADNAWSDAAGCSQVVDDTACGVVDAHVYAGFTYDYYFRRFGRNGLNNANLQIWSFTNLVRVQDYVFYLNRFPNYYVNAAYIGGGNIFYGVGLPSNVTLGGQTWANLAGALDIVAHELSHGVTEFTSNLIYRNESGALNEAFSDMMGQSAELFFKQPLDKGASAADWGLGDEVIRPGGIRNMATPFTSFGDPDHYSIRFTGTADAGGVHINSGIVNHMYYLAIMGGTNRVSGLAVEGVGFDKREQIEKVIYRAFAQLLTSNATFSVARAVTIQAARDLFGIGSAPERAIIQAWTAVGVM